MSYDNYPPDVPEGDFEPLSRERANTWHGAGLLDASLQPSDCINEDEGEDDSSNQPSGSKDILSFASSSKKTSNRRNAWGNMSYSELIMQAIESSEDKRLTLVQIYNWMTLNVPYFQERTEGPASVGWKNSIRHNLSLHPQFMRLPNDKTGRSSWWVINHAAIKPSRTRRCDSLFLDRRNNRLNNRLHAMLASNLANEASQCVSISEADETEMLESYLPASTVSSHTSFRKRTYSNPTIVSNSSSFCESDLQHKVLRTTSTDLSSLSGSIRASSTLKMASTSFTDSLSSLIPRARFLSDSGCTFHSKPDLHFGQFSGNTSITSKLKDKDFNDEDSSLKDIEWFIPSTQLNMLNIAQKPPIKPTNASLLSPETDAPPSKLNSDIEKILLFQLMKSEKITKLRKKNPEFERRICEAILKKKKMLLQQQQLEQQQKDEAHIQASQTFLNNIILNLKKTVLSSNTTNKSSSDKEATIRLSKEECQAVSIPETYASDDKLSEDRSCSFENASKTLTDTDDNKTVAENKWLNSNEEYAQFNEGILPHFSTDFESLFLDSDNILENILNLDMETIADLNLDFLNV